MRSTFPGILDARLSTLFLAGSPETTCIGKRGRRESRVLLPGLPRETERAGWVGFGIGSRDIIGGTTRVRAYQLKRFGPILRLQCQFGPLLTKPCGARMGYFSLLGDNQRLGPIMAIDGLAQQTPEPEEAGVLLFYQGPEGFLRLILSPGQSSRFSH